MPPLRQFWTTLVPPVNATDEALAMWRMGVFMAIVGLAAILSAHISVSSGLLGEERGFATQAAVGSLRSEMEGLTRRSLEIDILNLRVRQCEAMGNGNQDAARFTGETLQERRVEYAQVTERTYPLPSCREVGVDT